jgi:hypothetical protein
MEFVSFGIGTNNCVEYRIRHSLLSMRSNRLLLCGQVMEGATYRLVKNFLVLCVGIVY